MVACGGGGGGGGGGSTTPVATGAPTLTSVVLTSPSKDNVPKSTVLDFTFQTSFTDKEGDVGGGIIYFQYAPTTYSGVLPATDLTSGVITSIVINVATDNEDTKTTYVWIKDKAGNESNKLPITLIQK